MISSKIVLETASLLAFLFVISLLVSLLLVISCILFLPDLLGVTWADMTIWPAASAAGATGVLDYFCQRSNPFYIHTSNNEIARMQRVPLENLK